MVAKFEKITPAAVVGDCRHRAVGQGLEGGLQFAHYIKTAEKVSMPECKAVRKKECKFCWKVRPHDFESEMGVEVNQY